MIECYPRYEKKFGSFYFLGEPILSGGEPVIIFMTDVVSIAFDLSMFGDGKAILIKHGPPANVEKYVETYRKKLLAEGSEFSFGIAESIRSITLPADFDIVELNCCVQNTGYLTYMLEKFCPEALVLPEPPAPGRKRLGESND